MTKFTKPLGLVVGIMLLSVAACFAQPFPGDPGIPPEIPIDGGLSWLAAAGVAYGVRKVYLNNKLKNTGEEENS